jgi:hypothetical protein
MKALRYLSPLLVFLCIGTKAIANGNKSVQITNNTSYTMTEFYASDVDNATWDTTSNLLSGQTLAPGQQANVDINDGTGNCNYDLMGVLYGAAQYAYKYSIDACDSGQWTITGN